MVKHRAVAELTIRRLLPAAIFKWATRYEDKATLERFVEKIQFSSHGCHEWVAGKRGKYGEFLYQGKIWPAHAIAFLFAYGPFGDSWILHKCDNPPCVNPKHLFKGTALDNNLDTRAKGRAPWQTNPDWGWWMHGDNHWHRRFPERIKKGSACGRAKLTELQVLDIRRRNAAGETKVALAAEYKVAESLIYAICYRKLWRHI